MSTAKPKKPAAPKIKNGKTIKMLFDEHQNKIIATECDKLIVLDLKLAAEPRRRRIGIITKSTGAFNIVRERGKHLHILSNSYGFNHKILEISKLIKEVVLTDNVTRYKIPKEYILEHGKFLFFKNQGFELQTFVTLDELRQFEVRHIF